MELQRCREALEELGGFLGAALISQDGECRELVGSDAERLRLAAKDLADFWREHRGALDAMGQREAPEDLLLSSPEHYQLLRPWGVAGDLFIALFLRDRTNPALLRKVIAGLH